MMRFLYSSQRFLLVIVGICMFIISTSFLRQEPTYGLLFICSMFFLGGVGAVYLGFNLKE